MAAPISKNVVPSNAMQMCDAITGQMGEKTVHWIVDDTTTARIFGQNGHLNTYLEYVDTIGNADTPSYIIHTNIM